MALTAAEKQKIREEEQYRQSVKTPVKQTYGLPALLSFFIPGLGQMVKGEIAKGILTFIGFCLGCFFLLIPGIVIWIWQIMDAYNTQVE